MNYAIRMCILEPIFNGGFRNEIVWCYSGACHAIHKFPNKHDSIFWYAKSCEARFNKETARVPYAEATVKRSRYGGKPTDGMPLDSRDINSAGKIVEDWWNDIAPIHNLRKENIHYPTQKSEALLERIIKASS